MLLRRLICVTSCCAWCAAPVAAARITVDPDAYPVGAEISEAFAGVTLAALDSGSANGSGVTTPQVFSRFSVHASTGNRVFGNASYSELWFSDSAELRVDFARPTSFVSLDLIADDAFDPSVLRAFSASGVLLAETAVSGTAGAGVAEPATIARFSADIAYLIAANPSDMHGQQFLIDRLVYESRDPHVALDTHAWQHPTGVGLALLEGSRQSVNAPEPGGVTLLNIGAGMIAWIFNFRDSLRLRRSS